MIFSIFYLEIEKITSPISKLLFYHKIENPVEVTIRDYWLNYDKYEGYFCINGMVFKLKYPILTVSQNIRIRYWL